MGRYRFGEAVKKATHHRTPRCTRQRCGKAELSAGLCRSHLIDACDAIARADALSRHPVCVRCGSTRTLQWSHHLSRRFMSIRWAPMNATVHCAACHKLLTEHPALHTEHILDLIGVENYDRLLDSAYGPRDEHSGVRTGPPQFKHADIVAWHETLSGGTA